MDSTDFSDEGFERKRRRAIAGFLAALVVSQLGFFLLLRAGVFWSGYFFNAVLWTGAFVLWSRLLAPLRAYRVLLCAFLFILVLGGEIGSLILAQGFSDSAYCSTVYRNDETCFIAAETQSAGIFFSFFFIPVTLLALVVAITTALRQPTARPVEPGPDAALRGEAPSPASVKDTGGSVRSTWVIAAGIFVLAFVTLLVFILLNIRPPT